MREDIRYITKVEIKNLWGYEDLNFVWNLNPDVNILAGDNGSGKSTLLKLIDVTLRREQEEAEILKKAASVKVQFDNGNVFISELNENFQTILEIRNVNGYIKESSGSFAFINTFEQPLKDIETIKRATNNEVSTELDLRIAALQKQYLGYQINIGNRAIKALENGENGISSINAKKTLFLDTIDALFSHTQKKIDRTQNEVTFIQRGEKAISPYQLSSGEKQMLIILLTTLVQDNKHFIMLMDEPEISLHTDWQENLVDNIRKLNENVQIIIATHSPSIVVNGWKDKVFEMSEIQTKS